MFHFDREKFWQVRHVTVSKTIRALNEGVPVES
jgi:hypothetical protein